MNKLREFVNKEYDLAEVYELCTGKHPPTGKCFCPFHDNKNTPAAKIYGNVLHCFVCGKNYGPYEFLQKFYPEKLEEMKTVVLDTEQIRIGKVQHNLRVDRTKPIEEVLDQILQTYECQNNI